MKKEQLREIIHHFKPEEDIEVKVLECLWEYYDLLCELEKKESSQIAGTISINEREKSKPYTGGTIKINGEDYPVIDCNKATTYVKNSCDGCIFYEQYVKDGGVYVGDAPCQWCDKNPIKISWNDSISGTINATAYSSQSFDYADETGLPYGKINMHVGKTVNAERVAKDLKAKGKLPDIDTNAENPFVVKEK